MKLLEVTETSSGLHSSELLLLGFLFFKASLCGLEHVI